MPCSDGYPSGSYTVYLDGFDPASAAEIKRLETRNNELADLLCKVGRAAYGSTEIPREVIEWWEEHRKIDGCRGEPWPLPKNQTL